MKRIFFTTFLLALPVMVNAEPMQGGFGGGKSGGFMAQLTDEQRACLEAQNCPRPDMKMKKGGEMKSGEMPDKKEMTPEEKAAREASRECMKKAFETCGIQMPERPEGDKRQRPEKSVTERGVSERS